jgi:hypothetical protein
VRERWSDSAKKWISQSTPALPSGTSTQSEGNNASAMEPPKVLSQDLFPDFVGGTAGISHPPIMTIKSL